MTTLEITSIASFYTEGSVKWVVLVAAETISKHKCSELCHIDLNKANKAVILCLYYTVVLLYTLL